MKIVLIFNCEWKHVKKDWNTLSQVNIRVVNIYYYILTYYNK